MTKRDFALLAALYAAWLLCAYVVNIVVTGARTPADILHEWVRFDGIFFRAIAEFGYDEASRIIRWQQGFAFLTAAFPLFPLLVHLVAPFFGGDYTVAAVLVPQTLTFLVLVALFRLVRLDFSRTVAWWTTLSLLTFPTFYFMVAPYSEPLFLLLVILAFHEYRKGRPWPAGGTAQVSRAAVGEAGSLVRAGFFGALASAARIVGAPLLLGAFALDGLYKMWLAARTARPAERDAQVAGLNTPSSNLHVQTHIGEAPMRKRNLASLPSNPHLPSSNFRLHPSSLIPPPSTLLSLAVIPLGLLTYMVYQWWDFGNPLIFLRGHASSEWRVGFDLLGPVRSLGLPFYTVLVRDWTSAIFRTNMFNSLFFYFGLGVTAYAWRKLPTVYSFYGLLAIFVPTLSGSLISMPRFLLVSFPMFIGLGLLCDAHPRLRVLPVLLGLMGLVATALFFQTVFLG